MPKLLKTRLAAALLAATALLAACGGASATGGIPTPQDVRQCILDGGGEAWIQTPLEPKDAPKHVKTVFMIGPHRAHISVYFARRPEYTPRLVKEFDEILEYKATRIWKGKGLLLLDPDITPKDRKLALECVAG